MKSKEEILWPLIFNCLDGGDGTAAVSLLDAEEAMETYAAQVRQAHEAELSAKDIDIHILKACLGYPSNIHMVNQLSDGTIPKNRIAEAMSERIEALEAEVKLYEAAIKSQIELKEQYKAIVKRYAHDLQEAKTSYAALHENFMDARRMLDEDAEKIKAMRAEIDAANDRIRKLETIITHP